MRRRRLWQRALYVASGSVLRDRASGPPLRGLPYLRRSAFSTAPSLSGLVVKISLSLRRA